MSCPLDNKPTSCLDCPHWVLGECRYPQTELKVKRAKIETVDEEDITLKNVLVTHEWWVGLEYIPEQGEDIPARVASSLVKRVIRVVGVKK